jgi:hypothetical protein
LPPGRLEEGDSEDVNMVVGEELDVSPITAALVLIKS